VSRPTGWYAEKVFPWMLSWVEGPHVRKRQAAQVAQAQGRVLEVGFGVGQSLDWYPEAVEHLTAIEPNAGMRAAASERLAHSPLEVELLDAMGEDLPVEDGAFDTALVLLTLCSVTDPARVMAEVHRALKPGGTLLFFEHVASPDPRLRAWQRRLDPVWRCAGVGCNLSRDAVQTIDQADFSMDELAVSDLPGMPSIVHFVHGRATRI